MKTFTFINLPIRSIYLLAILLILWSIIYFLVPLPSDPWRDFVKLVSPTIFAIYLGSTKKPDRVLQCLSFFAAFYIWAGAAATITILTSLIFLKSPLWDMSGTTILLIAISLAIMYFGIQIYNARKIYINLGKVIVVVQSVILAIVVEKLFKTDTPLLIKLATVGYLILSLVFLLILFMASPKVIQSPNDAEENVTAHDKQNNDTGRKDQ